MNETEVNAKLAQIFRQVFPAHQQEFTGNDSVETIGDWDSLGHIKLMLAIETAFKHKLSTAAMLELNSIAKIQIYLIEKGVL